MSTTTASDRSVSDAQLLRAWHSPTSIPWDAYTFFRSQGSDPRTAFVLAQAEQQARDEGFHAVWEVDAGEPYEDMLGDHAHWCEAEQRGRCEGHEIEQVTLYDDDCIARASCGAVIDPSREYRRVLEAELALQALTGPEGR